MRPAPDAPVVALDLDGTSGDYHGHFTLFIEGWTGRPMPSPAQYTGGVPFHKHLRVSRKTYNQAKLAFRQGGLKRSMPAYEGIGDLTHYIRTKGVQLWICTTRPYLRLDNIDPDTRHWLKRNHLQYDAVIYGPHKYSDLVRNVGADRVIAVFDDLPALYWQADSLGLPVWLRTQPYNAYSGISRRVGSVDEMRAVFDQALQEWKEKHDGR